MRKLLVVLLLVGAALGQTKTTVTGVVQDASGNLATSGTVVFTLSPQNNGVIYFVTGTGIIAPQIGTCGIDGSGNIKNLALSGACQVWGTDLIQPANLTYQVAFFPNGVGSPTNTVPQQCITGTTYDLSNPKFCPVIKPTPQWASVITSPIQNNLIPSADNVFTLGSSGLRYSNVFASNGTFTNVTALNIPVGTINTGTGTTNTLTKFTNGATGVIGNSGITDNGTTISTSENITATVGQNSFAFYKANGKTAIDGNKYPLTSTGIQTAINDAVSSGTYEVDLPCADVSINATVNVTNSDVSLVGCAGGDLNTLLTGAVTRFIAVPPMSSTQDVLNMDCSPSRCTGLRVYNLMLDGNGIARYALRQNSQDTTYLENVKVRGGLTANHYHVNSTGTSLQNYQNNCQQNGGAGLVIDWGSSIFNAYSASWDTGGCNANTGPLLWIGGGSNRNIKFDGSQMNINTATPTGFIRIAGYDTVSPWPSAGTPVVGAPDTVSWNGLDLLYGANSPAAASQGADVLINGTATNRPANIYFDKFKFDARLSSTPGQTAVKSDNAQNVNLMNGISQGHTSAPACTLNVTSNTFSPGAHMVNVNSTNVIGADTNRTCGLTSSIFDLAFVFNGMKINGGTALSGQTGSGANIVTDTSPIITSATLTTATKVGFQNPMFFNNTPTISSGFGTSPSVTVSNGTADFRINVGTGGTAVAGVIGLPTAANGWDCDCEDRTTFSTTVFKCRQTGESTSTATIGNFNSSAASAAWVASDLIAVKCHAR